MHCSRSTTQREPFRGKGHSCQTTHVVCQPADLKCAMTCLPRAPATNHQCSIHDRLSELAMAFTKRNGANKSIEMGDVNSITIKYRL